MKIKIEMNLDNKIYTDKIVVKILELQEIIDDLYSNVGIHNFEFENTLHFMLNQKNEIAIKD